MPIKDGMTIGCAGLGNMGGAIIGGLAKEFPRERLFGYDKDRDKAAGILARVGLGDRVFHRPYELSGGQQQRVAVARAIANDPVIILADEPTANLDVQTGRDMIELLCQLQEEDRVTVISATHDMKMLDVSDRILWIRDGRIDRLEARGNLTIRVGRIDDETH